MTRPKKGRLAVGVLCGVLSGMADPAMLAAVVLVLQVIFPGAKLPMAAQTAPTVDPHPSWIQQMEQHLHESLRHAQTYVVDNLRHFIDDHHSAGSKAAVIAIIPTLMLARCIVFYLYGYLMSWVMVRAMADLRTRAFEHLLNLPLSFFGANSTGELMSRVGDINILQNVVTNSLTVVIKEPVTVIVLIAALFTYQWKLTVCVALCCPVILVPISIYSRKGRKSSGAAQATVAGLSRLMHESFTGNRIIKAYSLEKVVSQQFRTESGNYINHFMRMVRSTETPGPLIEFIGGVGAAILLFYFAMQPKASVSGLAYFIVGVFLMYRPIKSLVRLHSQLTQAKAATQRIMELLATENTLKDPPNPKPLKAAGGDIHFDNVSFAYRDKPVLRDIQLRVQPGEKVALVGTSGSGKTTLANLLLRFYDPTKGAIRVGGVDLREASLVDLRRQMAVVTQEVILFDETIRTNISHGCPGASDAQIEKAARHAFAHDFIMEKPGGYNTIVGEKGTNLSGGQKQRIAIARALLRNAPILVLDEATSALDNQAERVVQAALDELMKGRTTICIAHRLSTIQNFDRIIVMDAGEIVETGRHAELLARGGLYSKLHALGSVREDGMQPLVNADKPAA